MTVRVICDSSQNVPEAYLRQLGIVECLASLIFGDEVYLNKVDMSEAEFYQRLAHLPKGAALPTTTQPSPGQFIDALRQVKAEGATSAIITAVSTKLSGTHNSAIQAAQAEMDIPVTVWDTTSVSIGGGWQTIRAGEMAQAGASRDEIMAALPFIRDNITTVFTVDTLKYLAASGRLSSAQAMMGTLLSVKPMLMVDDGLLKPVGRERGRKSAKTALIELARAKVGDQPVRVAIANTNVADEARAFEPEVRAALNVQELLIIELGPVLAALAGPGVMALGVMQVTR
ncbi:MAG TPA: DegV family protein [Anaerolineae bacterium]|nr:DegV family protein [Anaerolineae bacterium]